MDLEEFAQHVDDVLMRPTGFAQAAADWRRGSKIVTQLGSRSAWRKELYACAEKIVGPEGYVHHNHLKIIRRHVEAHTQAKVLSAVVKKRSGELWEAAGLPSFRMGIDHPHAVLQPPRVYPGVTEVAAAMETAKLNLRHARASEAHGKEVILDVAAGLKAETGWNGSDPVYRLNDGWRIGWTENQRFNSARAVTLAPEFGVDPQEITTLVTVPARVYYVITHSEGGGEGDEIVDDEMAD